MKEKLASIWEKIKKLWNERTRRQKILIIGSVSVLVVAAVVLLFALNRTTFVPLYSNLTPAETGSIKEALDERGVESQITDDGTTIKVPKDMVDTLLVELAAEGIPQSGNIDYSYFSKNSGLGMTDKEFNIMKLDAMQTELANLIKKIDGIRDAQVMINLPEEGIFVSDEKEEASASIVLTTEPGYHFSENQIKALYTLVSKSVPNLPTDNIVIMDQNFEYFDIQSEDQVSGGGFSNQYEIKKKIERDIQRQVQNFLGSLMGQGNVIVSVTTDIDFTQEKREENRVEPVDKDNMEGIAVSAQRLTESYAGSGAEAGGIPASEDENDILDGSYVEGTNGSGDYEKTEETINYEVDRIKKEIVESPYRIRDIGLQVVVEPPDQDSGIDRTTIEEDIKKILSTIVRTTIHKENGQEELTDQEVENKIAVSFQPLLGKTAAESSAKGAAIPVWVYIAGAVLLLIILALVVLLIRRRKMAQAEMAAEEQKAAAQPVQIPDLENTVEKESTLRRKRLERLADEHPDEFAKLIRTWLSQD